MTERARDWCLTLNNYTEEECKEIESFSGRYIIIGFEQGENGTRHWQGYCEYENPVGMARVKRDTSYRVHLERRRGTQEQAIKYCKKDGNWWEKGERRPGQGARTDLQKVANDVAAGKSLREISEEHPVEWILYNRGITSLQNMKRTEQWREVEAVVYWGETGSGKTREAMKEESVYKLNQNTNGTLWFDGYNGETTLLLDDFYGWIKWGELLTLLDGYPYRCQIKGGYTWARWTKVILTSNKHPEEWYDRKDKDALWRRLKSIEKFCR